MKNQTTDTNIVFANKFDFTETEFISFINFLTQNEDLSRAYWRQQNEWCTKFESVPIVEAYYKDEFIGLIIFKS